MKKRPLSKRPKICFEDQLGDNCIHNFHLGRYIVEYTVGNLVLRRCVSRAFKRDFRAYFRRYTSPNENFEYGYPHSNALLTFSLQKDSENVLCCAYTSSDASCIKPHASCIYSLVNQWKATLRNDVGFPTVYRRTYCRKGRVTVWPFFGPRWIWLKFKYMVVWSLPFHMSMFLN